MKQNLHMSNKPVTSYILVNPSLFGYTSNHTFFNEKLRSLNNLTL